MARVDIIIEAQNRAQLAFQQLQADLRQSNVHLERIAENTTKVARETVKLTRSQQIVKRLRNEYNFLRTEVANTAAVTSRFAGALQRQARAQFEAAASLERLTVSLTIISGSTAAATQQYQRLLEAARLPGINLQNSLRASLQLQAIGKSGEEATTIIKEFGNAFALAGGSGQQLGGVVHGIRQIISDGKVLQRELNIITSRIAILTPIMQEAFGGNRAEDVRAFAESIGRGDDTVGVFFETILAGLKELPRAGNTAANAIENLADSYERAQAAIGSNFLPIVKEATAALEGVFKVVERSPEIARSIAIFEALGGTFLTVTAAGVGLAAALPAIAAAVASLGAPILIPIAAVAALTAGFVALTVASQDVETRIEALAATFDELDTALRKNHEAIESNQQAQVESAQSSLTAQRTAIQGHITLLGEEIASIERSIAANRRRAEQGLLPIASTGEGFGTQLEKANARLEVTRQKLLEVNDALRANEEASVPIQKAAVNIETLTKAVTRLKDELQEETTFEGISQGITGDPTSFRQSAQALADIEVLVRVNADRFTELGEAAASGNQEAATALSKLNQQFEGLRDTQADRHVDNLSAAFDELSQSANVTSSQLEAVLQATQAFENAFQGTGGLITDDVARAAELIVDIQTRLNSVRREEQLPEPERQRQADEAPESQIGRITEQRQAELEAQVEVARQLFQIRKDIREAENQEEIDAAEEQATALLRVNGRFVSQFIELRGLIADEAIAQSETLRDQSLALLANEVEERQALYEDDLKAQRQVEQAKRQENQKTYDFDAYLTGLRTKNRQAAAQDLVRLEEQSLDVSSQRQRENLIRETNQFVESYRERGEAFKDLVAAAQELGGEIQQAFDLSEQQRRLEDFRDSVAGVLDNLAGITIDHVFDGFFGAADEAAQAISTFTDVFRGDIELLENDVTRLARQVEDSKTRLLRLDQDESRRIRQLERQRRSLLARASTGNQRDAERTRQRAQDISFRISNLREDFGVRRSRTTEDDNLRRNRAIDDATQRRENVGTRGTDESLISTLLASLTNSLSNTLSSTISTAIASALGGALSGQFSGLIDSIKGLFGGGPSTTPTPALPVPTPGTGTPDITAPTDAVAIKGAVTLATTDITVPAEAVAIKGAVSLALADITAPTEAVKLTGDINTLTVSAVPPIIYLKGVIKELMVDGATTVPAPIGLGGLINKLTTDPAAEIPVVNPAAIIRSITTDSAAVVPQVNPAGVIKDITTDANAVIPVVNPAGVIQELSVSPDAVTPAVNPDGVIQSLSIDPRVPPLTVDMTGNVNELRKSFAEPIPLEAIADLKLNLPDVDLLDPIDLSGLRFSNVPNIPLRLTPDTPQEGEDGTPDEDTGNRTPASDEGTDDTGTTTRDSERLNQIRDRTPGQGRSAVPGGGEGSGGGFLNAINSLKDSIDSGLESALSALPDSIEGVVRAVLGTGIGIGGDGVSLGAAGGGLTDAQVEALAASLGEDLDSSFRSDFIPTLLGNNPGQAQLGDADPDDDTVARAPAAPRFNQATAAGVSAVADVLSLEALANVAQETTLVGVLTSLEGIRSATERVADAPLVQGLADAGVSLMSDPTDPTNAALTQSPVFDFLSQGGAGDFLALQQIGELMGEPTPDLLQIGSEESPGFFNILNLPETQKVEVVGGKVDANVTNEVTVKQAGAFAVTQGGEFVVQLASGGTLPVIVQGGQMTVQISGGLDVLAIELDEIEVALRDLGAI